MMIPRCDWRDAPNCAEPVVADLVYVRPGGVTASDRRPLCRIHAMAILEHCIRSGLAVPYLQMRTPSGELVGAVKAAAGRVIRAA